MVKRIRKKIHCSTANLDKNIRIALYALLIIVLWVLSGLFVDRPEIEENRYKKVVKTVAVQPLEAVEYTQMVTVTGRTMAESIANVAARTEGLVKKIHVKQGQTVKKGDTLLEIDESARQSMVESALAKLDEAKSLYEVAQKLHAEGFRSDTALASSKSSLEAAKQALDVAKKDLSYTKMTSPVNGFVEERLVDDGDYIKVGATAFSIIDKSSSLIVAYIPQKEKDLVHVGKAAQATLINGMQVEGKVRFIASSADETTKTYRTEILVDGTQYDMPIGMTANVKIPVETVLAHNIPQSALVLSDEGLVGIKYVDDASVVHFKEVASLSNDLGGLWITGLPEKINLIRLGQSDVKIGETVTARVIEKEKEAKMLKETEINHDAKNKEEVKGE